MKKRLLLIALLTAAPVLGSYAQEYLPDWQEGYFDIHAIATGKGEQTFMIMPDGTTMLIDAGDMTGTKWNGKPLPDGSLTPGEWIARYIKHFAKSDKVDCFLLTHLHSDHMGSEAAFRPGPNGYSLSGVSMVGEHIHFNKIVDRGYPDYDFPSKEYKENKAPCSMNYRKFVEWKVRNEGTKAEKFVIGSHTQLGMVHSPGKWAFDVHNIASNSHISTGRGLRTRPMYGKDVDPEDFDENLNSNVVLFTYGKFTYYHGGDIAGNTWPTAKRFDRNFESAIADFIGHPVTVMKADHHATRDSSNPYFLWKMRPDHIIFHACESKHGWPDTVRRMLDPQMPGCKSIFPTGDAGRELLGEEMWARLRPAGHVVVRVYPGGEKYRIYVLDSSSKDYRVIFDTGEITP